MKLPLAPTPAKRVFFFVVSDVAIIVLSLYAAFLMRFDFSIPDIYVGVFSASLPFFIFSKLFFFFLFRVYRITWRYAGLHDLINVAKASLSAAALLFVIIYSLVNFFGYLPLLGFPRSVFIIDWAVSFILFTGLRTSRRVFLEHINRRGRAEGLPAIIIGAGNVGETVLRDIIKNNFRDYLPVALLDDDPQKIGLDIHGVRVTGAVGTLKEAVKAYRAEAVIIAIPSLDYKSLRTIFGQTKETSVKTVKIVPEIYSKEEPEISVKKLEEISIEDIIGRQNVEIDLGEIEAFLKNKTVLVTGAGGSIGSEIVMQVLAFKPGRVVLLDNDETELFNMERKTGAGKKISCVVADVSDRKRLDAVFREFSPGVVFHSAAYKHVPMMEKNPGEAVRTNIFGTCNAAKAACASGAEKFILISTDKAVRPKSVMGATKKIAEYICRSMDGEGGCRFISVRFGNVLGSRGSILPLFLEQLKAGGPLTVTHRDMKRYFMTIPEAVALVLQASVLGKGGDIMVLDMGEPVRITSLAEDLISLHGLRPYDDIGIEFTGIRPGENLFEEILTSGERATKHEQIFTVGNPGAAVVETGIMLGEFERALGEDDLDKIRELLGKYAGA